MTITLLSVKDRDRYEEAFADHQQRDSVPEGAMLAHITQMFVGETYIGATLLIYDEYYVGLSGIPTPNERHWLFVDVDWADFVFTQRDALYEKLSNLGHTSVNTVSYFLSDSGVYEQDLVGTINVAECMATLTP